MEVTFQRGSMIVVKDPKDKNTLETSVILFLRIKVSTTRMIIFVEIFMFSRKHVIVQGTCCCGTK